MTRIKNLFSGNSIYYLFVLFAAMGVAGVSGYFIGYREGSVTLTSPPTHLGLINTNMTGDPGLVLDDPGQRIDFGNFWRTWHILEKNFAPTSTSTRAASSTEMHVVGAIEGLARSYNDPYTVFIPKKEALAFKEQVNGEFEGIGAALNQENGVTKVVAILPHSPAEAAGLAKGALILAVDGDTTADEGLETIIPRIRGPRDTTVVLTIMREGASQEEKLPIIRGTVAIPTTATRVVTAAQSVIAAAAEKARKSAAALSGAVAEAVKEKEEQAEKQEFFVLLLAQFAKSSIDAFIADLKKFAESDTRYLIIDLRNNPGGYMGVAVDLASYFLPEGALIVTDRSGAQSQAVEYRSVGHDTLNALTSRRIVVIVNRNSASASEILAGALQDHGVAKIVGERSFGKGSVQTLVDIGDIGSLKITISRWFTPLGKNISETGIIPDILVDPADPKYASSTDPFIDAATETLLDDSLWEKQE